MLSKTPQSILKYQFLNGKHNLISQIQNISISQISENH